MRLAIKTKQFILVLLILILLIDLLPLQGRTDLLTDLGQVGNDYVARRFDSYKQKFPTGQCVRQNPSLPGAIVTGFGLFAGVNYNISGAVSNSMGAPTFLPAVLNTKKNLNVTGQPELGLLTEDNMGARALTRVLEINSKKVEVCFLTLEVVWDLSASIILYEAQTFNPEAILMMGRQGYSNELRFEGASQNDSTGGSGYNFEGTMLVPENTPESTRVLDSMLYGLDIKFNWNAKGLAKAAAAVLKGTSFTTNYETEAGPEDSYLCNNVSFVVAAATQNQKISLAGGQIVMPQNILKPKTAFGFLHLPPVDESEPTLTSATVELLSRVVANTLYNML